MDGSEAREQGSLIGTLPFVRTFRSPRFRLVIGAVAVLVGVALNALRLTTFDIADPGFAFDFAAYYHAAERMVAGSSPYTSPEGERLGVGLCLDCYIYPPFFAQILSPITLVPLESAKVIWIAIGYLAAFASTWLATGIGGAPRSLERAVWCLAAVLTFDAVASAVWNGNVGTLVALVVTVVAMGGVAAGTAAGLGALIKVSPATLLPAVLASDRESRTSLILVLVAVTGSLFLLAPQAWLEYPMVLWDVFASPAGAGENLAFGQVASRSGWGSDAIAILRLAMLAAGAVCVAISIVLARRPGGMPAASLLGTAAMLIIPGTLWFHYLAVLLPFGAMAWPRASPTTRGLLLISAAVVGVAPMFGEQPGQVYVGSAILLTTAGWVLWPRRAIPQVQSTAPSHPTASRP